MYKLTNAKEMLKKAVENKYAIAHINTNNLEWTKAILLTAQETRTPVIIGASEGAIKYMGGYNVVSALVNSLMHDLKIDVPVALHLDHGTYEGAKKAMEAGFSSIMFDGSHLEFADNLSKTKELVKMAEEKNLSFEAEVGSIGGEEDGVIGTGELADISECVELASTGVDALASGIGNIHGAYPENWQGLDFNQLEKISHAVPGKAIVLHGGSGIPDEQVRKAISLGIAKVNVNSELQWAFAEATVSYCAEGKANGKGKDPRKLLKPGYDAMIKVIKDKFELFGCIGKA